MDPDKDIAEERLLRVIEKGQARTASVAIGATKAWNPFKWLRVWLAQNYARPIGRESDPTLKILKTLSAFLWLGLACFSIYFAMDYISHRNAPFQSRIFKAAKHGTAATGQIEPVLEDKLKTEAHYVEALQNPNPFTGVAEEVKVTEEVRGPSAGDKLAEMSKGLVVVGINRGATPDAIIENSKEKRTFFVKVGDKVNEMTVKEIKHDTVVLSYEGQDVEIV